MTDAPTVEALLGWPPLVRPLPAKPAEDPVFEDYFPIGSVPAEICPTHNGEASIESHASTPITSHPSTPISVQRTMRPDGTIAISVRGGG